MDALSSLPHTHTLLQGPSQGGGEATLGCAMLSSAEPLEKSWKDTAKHPCISQGWKRPFCQCTNIPFLSLDHPGNQKRSRGKKYWEVIQKQQTACTTGLDLESPCYIWQQQGSSGLHPSLFRSNRFSLTSLARTPLSFNSSWKTPPWCPTYWNARIGTRHKFVLVTTFP